MEVKQQLEPLQVFWDSSLAGLGISFGPIKGYLLAQSGFSNPRLSLKNNTVWFILLWMRAEQVFYAYMFFGSAKEGAVSGTGGIDKKKERVCEHKRSVQCCFPFLMVQDSGLGSFAFFERFICSSKKGKNPRTFFLFLVWIEY